VLLCCWSFLARQRQFTVWGCFKTFSSFFFRFFFLNEENWLLQPQVRPHSRRDVFVGGYTVNWDAAWRHVRMPKLLYVRMKWLNTVVYARKIAGKKWEGQYFVWKKKSSIVRWLKHSWWPDT
jgi:hypothetical protein